MKINFLITHLIGDKGRKLTFISIHLYLSANDDCVTEKITDQVFLIWPKIPVRNNGLKAQKIQFI